MIATTTLLVLGIGYRTGRFGLLGRAANHASRMSGQPAWAALPAGVAAGRW